METACRLVCISYTTGTQQHTADQMGPGPTPDSSVLSKGVGPTRPGGPGVHAGQYTTHWTKTARCRFLGSSARPAKGTRLHALGQQLMQLQQHVDGYGSLPGAIVGGGQAAPGGSTCCWGQRDLATASGCRVGAPPGGGPGRWRGVPGHSRRVDAHGCTDVDSSSKPGEDIYTGG